MYTPPLRYKREALTIHTQAHTDARWTQIQALPDSSNTAHSGRRVLRSGGPNHSKPAVFIVFFVFLSEIELVLANPEHSLSALRRVHSVTRLWFATPRQRTITTSTAMIYQSVIWFMLLRNFEKSNGNHVVDCSFRYKKKKIFLNAKIEK